VNIAGRKDKRDPLPYC